MINKPADLDRFRSVTEWVFDLDNTLYPRNCDLFAQIDWKMTDYVAELLDLPKDEARKLQKDMYREHGTTMHGLMERYNVDPHDFMNKVHDIDYSLVEPNPLLGEMIAALPGRKHIFTNGDIPHAERTTDRLGIREHFDHWFDIVASDFIPKPAEEPYRKFLKDHVVEPASAAMFEDMPRNLTVPRKLGMTTILVLASKESTGMAEAWEHEIEEAADIDFTTNSLDDFLANVLEGIA